MSSKSVNTLVEDIYGLFSENRVDLSISYEDTVEFGQRLAQKLSNRITEERGSDTLRLSNIGTQCERQLWYKINASLEAQPIEPATYIKFKYGDILEEFLLFLATQAGHEITNEQMEVEVAGVKGHIDALVDSHLVDVKSASSPSFIKFRNHTLDNSDSFGYLTQLGLYSFAVGHKQGSFLAIDKQMGYICLDTWKLPKIDYITMVNKKKDMVSGKIPPRGFLLETDKKTGKPKLAMNCRYCSFSQTCYPGVSK